MYVLPLHAGTIINFIVFSHFVIEVGLKAKGIKENLVINIHAVFPVTMIVSPDFLVSVMPSLLSGMTAGWILRFVTRQNWLQLIWIKCATVLFRIFWLSFTVSRNLSDTIFPSVPPRWNKQQFYLQCVYMFRMSMIFGTYKCGINWSQNGKAEHKNISKSYHWISVLIFVSSVFFMT